VSYPGISEQEVKHFTCHLRDESSSNRADFSHDEHIEADKLFHPGNDTPLMVGFCYISKMLHSGFTTPVCELISVMGRVLSMRRGDRRSPPSGINLELRLEQVMASYRLICHLMDNCPAALRLDAFSG
jgi:hypothetical protein